MNDIADSNKVKKKSLVKAVVGSFESLQTFQPKPGEQNSYVH
ncbi:MAG: hypothetical protein Q7T76_09630 [Ferruginibacter sp.]|nr:hypothetical protein [Ferruginibacter sp.]